MRLIVVLFLILAALGARSPAVEPVNRQIATQMGHAWRVTWDRFFLEETNQFYDYLTRYDSGRELEHLPKVEEVQSQTPNDCGYGTGMEDCMISAGVLLSMIVDRYAVTGDDSLREKAEKVVRGIQLSATVHGVPGFLARGVCPGDGKSTYLTSSRDQYTHAVHGLWVYAKSSLCPEESKRRIGTLLTAVADRMTQNVIPENNYDSLRSDGTRDPRGINRMWNVKGHEAARLPMIYAAAWDVTGKAEYRSRYRQYLDSAIEQSFHVESWQPTYALLQMQISMELLLAVETDDSRTKKITAVMKTVSDRCYERMLRAEQLGGQLDWTLLCTDWRTSAGLDSKGPYRKVWYNIREIGESVLAQQMSPHREDIRKRSDPDLRDPWQVLQASIRRIDFDRVSSCGIFYLQAAYWKYRRNTMP